MEKYDIFIVNGTKNREKLLPKYWLSEKREGDVGKLEKIQSLKKPNFWIMTGICGLLSFGGVFCILPVMSENSDISEISILLCAVGLAAMCIIVFFVTAFLCFLLQRERSISYQKALGRVLCTLLILIGAAILLSLLFGLIAVLLYAVLKSVLTLEEIKGVINYVISALQILSAPFFISVFWQELTQNSSFFALFCKGFFVGGKRYFKLLLLMVLVFGIGMLLQTAFHYLPNHIGFDVLKALLFSGIGTLAMLASKRICA